ncbi:hypothetical protein FHS14_003980 [Paenibacillus baekrokdamisoli]|nr:hypothetical protein [Paenibacillus baekrokdamisoli]
MKKLFYLILTLSLVLPIIPSGKANAAIQIRDPDPATVSPAGPRDTRSR